MNGLNVYFVPLFPPVYLSDIHDESRNSHRFQMRNSDCLTNAKADSRFL